MECRLGCDCVLVGHRQQRGRKPILLAERGHEPHSDCRRVADGSRDHGVRDAVLAGWRDVAINAYTYQAYNPATTAAVMSSPMPGSTFTGSSEMFSWNPVAGAQAYYLDIGTSMGGNQIYSVNQGTNTSVTVSTLPTDGSQVYVTLYTELGGTWYNNQYNYTAVTASLAVITAPSPGSPLTGTSQTFTWSTGNGPDAVLSGCRQQCWRKPILLAEPGDGDVGDGKRVAGGWQHGVRDAVLAGGRDVGIERVHVHGSAASIDHERVGDGRSRNVQLECGNQRDKLLSGSRLDTGRERSVLGESGDEPDGAGVRIAADGDDLHHAVLVDRRDVLQHANQHSRRLGRNPKEGADFGPRLFF